MDDVKKNQGVNTDTLKVDDLDEFREDGSGAHLTTNQGLRINDDQNSLKAGERGPTLLEDFHLREKITHFDHERIPERVVHARGAGAHGYFQVYESLAQYTKAGFLQDPSLKTPVFVRFSTVVGSRESADLARDARGFAVKFYTEEGNFDLVGNNIPVFFIQDAQVSRPGSCRKARTAQRNAAGGSGTRHFLGLYFTDSGIHAHDYVGDVGSRYPQKFPHDGRLRRSHFSFRQCRRQITFCKVSLETLARAPLSGLG